MIYQQGTVVFAADYRLFGEKMIPVISTAAKKMVGDIVLKNVEEELAYKFLEKTSDYTKRIVKRNAEKAEAKKPKYFNDRSVSSSTATSMAAEIISNNAEDEDEK